MREIRSSGSVEGVVSDHDPYSDYRCITLQRAADFVRRAQFTTLSRNAVFWRSNPVNWPNCGEVTLL